MNKEDILSGINDPEYLEKLFREDEVEFKNEFNLTYPAISGSPLAGFWNARLNYENSETTTKFDKSSSELLFIIVASLLAGFIAKVPDIFPINEDFYYPRNLGFVFLPLLIGYFAWKNKFDRTKILLLGVVILVLIIFMNLLPGDNNSHTLILSAVHLPLFLFSVLGYAFTGGDYKSFTKRLEFLRFNGDLLIVIAPILISGSILTGLSTLLFSLINVDVHEIYFRYVGVMGLSAAPIVAAYIVKSNPKLVSRVSPIIAKIFSPLVLITLVVYLIAMLFSGKNIYSDREFLLAFNFLLIGVMAIILFSVAGSFKKSEYKAGSIILLALSVLTIVVNCIALSAIIFRITELGLSPNRLAVLGSNVLIFANLLVVAFRLYRNVFKNSDIREVEDSITLFLPVYSVWAIIVVIIFPFIFRFI
ncbi:DUF4153 domain-containing protein [soil metagenome]